MHLMSSRSRLRKMVRHFTISILLSCYLPSLIEGVPQTNIAGLVGQVVDLPCVVDSAKCGELHSIKWYRGSSRIFVFSESANIAKSEGDYTDRAELQYDHNETRSSLRIKPVHVTDEALYKCEITYIEVREGCSVVQFINLTTQIKPEYLRISRGDGTELQNSSLIGPFSEGERLSLVCESGGGKPVPKVEWRNGSSLINGDYQVDSDSNGVGTGRNKIKLTIGRGDLGAKYECNAQNDALEVPLVSWIELDVNVRPLKMELTGVEHHVVQGTKVLLQCIVYGARPAANITWFNGTELMREDLISTTSAVKADGTYETQSNLVFTASRFENGGTLTCEAINSVMIDRDEPPMKSTLVLEVLYPPIVAVSPENITVNESTDILLFCSYEANPTLLKSVKWMRDGLEVELNPEHFTGGTTEEPTLLIKNSTRYDQGVYTCILENEVGATESSNAVYVNISYKPTVKVVMNPPSPVSELDKLNVTLICQVESGNPDILQVVRWYLDGSLLKELPECSPGNDTLCDIDPSRLLLEVVGRSFHGNYSCEGMNDAGWGPVSENSELVVYYPPGPATLTYEPKRVVKKSSVKLTCSVSDLGRPPSNTFRWVRGAHLIQDVTSANWTIDPVTLETESNFTCSAYNLGGEGDSASVYIEVFAPPAFIERLPPYHGALMSAQHISVSCRVECSPLCTVSWLKNGRPLDATPGASLLYSVKNTVIPADPRTNDFKSVQSTLLWNMSAWPGGKLDRIHDNANYTCQSTGNSVGSGVRSTTIFGVEYPPENITLSSKVISVVEGHVPEKVLCSAKAYPEASYHWRREGETETIIKGNALILNYPVPRRNGGNYVCEAYNRHGNVSGKIYLNVLFKPECGITQTETNGKPVLICTAHANPKEVDFTWKIKNENETVEDSIENQGLQSFLTLESRIENFRTYLCFANNSVGMSIPCERDVTGKAAWWPMFENDNFLIIVAVVVGAILMFLVICVIIIIVCRRKRADDKCPNQSGTADKLGLDPRGSQNDGLDERAFYENLPFHGMQNPPSKSDLGIINNRFRNERNFQNRSNRSISSDLGPTKFNTLRTSRCHSRSEPIFHSLRLQKREDGPSYPMSRVRTTTVLLRDLYPNGTCSHRQEERENQVTVPDEIASQKSTELANNEENSQKEIENSNNETKESVIVEDCTPSVPDRKNKPKFLNGRLKSRSEIDSELDDTFVNDDDNESLISGVERLSISPAPVPAPRKLISNSVSKLSSNNKHTYQNVPIPISPNNSQDVSPSSEKSLEARHYKLTSSQQHLLPLNNKKNAQQATYNLLQQQGKPRHCGRRSKYDTNSMRDSSRKYNDYLDGQPNMNGSLRQNQLFFNSLRDADRQLNNGIRDTSDFKNKINNKNEIKNNKDFREKTKERLKDSTPLQVMRFKDLLTAGGENYNRQSNSDSSGERRFNTDSSSGDTEMAISDSRHFKNISSGEESLLRDGSRSSYRGRDLEVYRPVPVNNSSAVREHRNHTNSLERNGRSLDRKENERTYAPPSTLPIQSFYTPMGSDPLLLPHYAPLGSDVTPSSEPHLPPMYTPGESDATPGGSDLTPLGSDPFVRDSVVYADLAHAAAVASERARVAQLRNSRNVSSDPKRNSEYASLKFHDVGQEIDV